MRVTKTFKITMVVTENIPPDDMEILCQVFNAEIIQYNLKTNNSRPHYVKYFVEQINEDVNPIT